MSEGVSQAKFGQRRKKVANLEAVALTGGNSIATTLFDVANEDVILYHDWLCPSG